MQNFENYKQEVIELRRHFHRHPELGFQEYETSKFIQEYLTNLGLEPKTIAKTGVVSLIKGKYPGKTLLLRADMDALAIQEENDVEYISQNPGVMHACGHDGHIAMLLVAAKILSKRTEDIHGTIKLVFQPNEEEDGASYLVKEGVLENPKVDSSFAIHLWTPIPSGYIGLKSGPVMAEMYNFRIELRGKGGHTSSPQNSVDPIVCAANIIQTVQSIQTREIDPLEPTVIMFGKIQGGTSSNIIADTVEMEGTLRYLYDGDDEGVQQPRKRFKRMVEAICEAYRVSCEVTFLPSSFTVINEENSVAFLKERVLNQIVDGNMVVPYCCMGGEDFSEYINHNNIPGALVFVGTGNPAVGSNIPHHRCDFNIDEDTLLTGVKIHVLTALEYLK